jgi:hypothetical protein
MRPNAQGFMLGLLMHTISHTLTETRPHYRIMERQLQRSRLHSKPCSKSKIAKNGPRFEEIQRMGWLGVMNWSRSYFSMNHRWTTSDVLWCERNSIEKNHEWNCIWSRNRQKILRSACFRCFTYVQMRIETSAAKPRCRIDWFAATSVMALEIHWDRMRPNTNPNMCSTWMFSAFCPETRPF